MDTEFRYEVYAVDDEGVIRYWGRYMALHNAKIGKSMAETTYGGAWIEDRVKGERVE